MSHEIPKILFVYNWAHYSLLNFWIEILVIATYNLKDEESKQNFNHSPLFNASTEISFSLWLNILIPIPNYKHISPN